MFLGLTATTVVAACFCLGPVPVPEQIPVAPDAVDTAIHAAIPSDAIPERCLASVGAWSHLTDSCPRMPVDPALHARSRPFVLNRVR